MAKGKILLVEDDAIESMDITRTLKSFGYDVPYTASRGEEAVEIAKKTKRTVGEEKFSRLNIDGKKSIATDFFPLTFSASLQNPSQIRKNAKRGRLPPVTYSTQSTQYAFKKTAPKRGCFCLKN